MIRPSLPIAVSIAIVSLIATGCSGANSQQQTSLDAPGTEAVPAVGWSSIKMNSYNYADTELDSFAHFTTVPNACHQDGAGALTLTLWNRIAKLVNQAVKLPALDQDHELCFDHPDSSKLYGTVDLVLTSPTANALVSASDVPTPMMSWPWPWPWHHHPSSTPSGSPTSQPSNTPIVFPSVMPQPSMTVHPITTPSPSPSVPEVKRTILEDQGAQICTTISNVQVAKDLVSALDQVASVAYKADCPLGY